MRWTESDLDNYQRRLGTGVAKALSTATARRPKYLNVKTTGADGIVHDAKGECERWEELKLMERAGAIRHLRRQVPFAMVVSGVLVCTYIADFVYEDGAATIVEDHKSPVTRKLAAFSIKRKLMQAIHGIQIREV
jgi:hypothetical protein